MPMPQQETSRLRSSVEDEIDNVAKIVYFHPNRNSECCLTGKQLSRSSSMPIKALLERPAVKCFRRFPGFISNISCTEIFAGTTIDRL